MQTALKDRIVTDHVVRFMHFGPQPQMAKRLDTVPLFDHVKGDYFANNYDYPNDTVTIDVQDIKFPDGFFDGLLILHVLEHVQNDLLAMRELYRVLKTGGFALIESPCNSLADESIDCTEMDSEERTRVCKQYDHMRLFSCSDIRDKLAKSGLRCHEFELGEEMHSKMSPFASMPQYLCEKD